MLTIIIALNAILVGIILYYERKDKKELDEAILALERKFKWLESRHNTVSASIIELRQKANLFRPIGNGKKSLLDRAGIKKKGPQSRPNA